jgi:hypothetical protein
MATVLIRFDDDKVRIVTGDIPPDAATPISNPQQTGFVTNQAFIVTEGAYCYGLDPSVACTPLWRILQAVDGQQTEARFRKVP